MRVLNVLVNTEFDALAHDLVDYLIDAGHHAYVLRPSHEQAKTWSERFTFNLSLIGAEDVARHPIDLEIGTTSGGSVFNLDKLSLHLERREDCHLGAWLSRKEGHALLRQETLPKSPEHAPGELLSAAKDLCIDSVILLARGHEPEKFSARAPEENHLAELAELSLAMQVSE